MSMRDDAVSVDPFALGYSTGASGEVAEASRGAQRLGSADGRKTFDVDGGHTL